MKSYVLKEFMKTPYRFAIVNLLDNELVAQAKTPLMAGALYSLYIEKYNEDNDCLCVIDKMHPTRPWMSTEEVSIIYECSKVRMLNIADNRRKAGFKVIRERWA